MADRGHELTDEILDSLENRVAEEYATASRDMQKKLRDYLEQMEAGRAKQKALLDAGEITQKEYNDWVFRHTMMGKRWEAMRDTLAEDLEKANEIALKISGEKMADVYCLNADFATYQIEHDARINTAYTLYNHDAAERLLKSPQKMMPGPSSRKAAQIAADKTMQWNQRRIQSAVLQGILQGEGPYKVAERLRSIATMNYNASVRYARTMTTNAQNAGRYDSYRRAEDKGVELVIEWQATLDGRTRHEHRMMHGQRRKVGEPFILDGVEILYPAQSSGPGSSDIPQSMVWNCRCTLLAWVKGFEGETVTRSPKMGDMSFEEWQHEKEPKREEAPEFVSRFKPAESIKEAEEFAMNFCDPSKQFGAVGVDYTGVELDIANRVNHTLIDLYDEFDVKPFGGIIAPAGNTRYGKMISGATAAYSPIQHSFLLNRKSLGKVKNAQKHFTESRAAIKDILEHPEKYDLSRASRLARQVIEASKTSGRDVVPDSIESAIYHEFGHSLEKSIRKLDSYETIVNNMSAYAPKLSGYATTEFSEYVAESFASWRLGEGLADPEIEKAFAMLRRRK